MKAILSACTLFLLLTPALAQEGAPAAVSQAEAQAAAQQASPVDATVPPPPQMPAAAPEPAAPQEPPAAGAPPDAPMPPRMHRHPLPPAQLVRPMADASSYPVSQKLADLSIGLRLLSPAEVEQKFSAPLKDYVVVEVGLFPANAQYPVALRLEDFTLGVAGDNQSFFASDWRDVADAVASGKANHRNVAFFPTVGVGYEGGRWGRGVSTGVGVGVGVGGSRPYGRGPMSGQRVIEQELSDKALPLSGLAQPVGGYLYFPVRPKKGAHYSLQLAHNGQSVNLDLGVVKK